MRHPVSAVLSGIHNVNALGVLRGLRRRGIPLILLDVDRRSMVRYSRFISRRIPCPDPHGAEEGFIDALMALGRSLDHRPVYIPTGDAEILALSRHREALSPFFRIPVASYDIIRLLVNKKRFFQDVIRREIPCPETRFPETAGQARQMARNMGFPLIIKPAYSHHFIRNFHKKVFVIHSASELETALKDIEDAGQDYFLQEIIPGNTLYLYYAYFNKESIPLGICGYDKVRQFPRDFGIGTLCRSMRRAQPIEAGVKYLQHIGYHGLAEPEFKRDPRDGLYKLIEINTRCVNQTLLAAACGVHMEYLVYRDLIGQNVPPEKPAADGMLWIDEINELHYHLSRIRRGFNTLSEITALGREKKVFAGAAIQDPVPFVVGLMRFFHDRLKSPRSADAMLNL